MIIRPQRHFTIVRQIANHTDTATYYVRAVIRDSFTDTILATLDLDSRGGQRFSKSWLVSPDPSGLGRDISIVTSVYTDAGYTTKSENYGDEENTHVIEDRLPSGRGAGNGGGIDSRTLRRVIQEELAAVEKPEAVKIPKFPKIPEVKFDPILAKLDELKTELKPEKPEKVDFKPLFEALESIRNDVKDKEVTEPTDISPILELLRDKDQIDDLTKTEVAQMLNKLEGAILKELPTIIAAMLKSTTFGISLMPTTMEGKTDPTPKQEKKEEPKAYDLSKLTS